MSEFQLASWIQEQVLRQW